MRKKQEGKRIIRIRKTVFFFVILPILIVDILFISLRFIPINGQNKLSQIILTIEQWHNEQIAKEVQQEVLPKGGFTTKIVLGNIVPELVSYGVIDRGKITELYKVRGGLTKEQTDLLDYYSDKPLVVNAQNATWLVNILWAIGLSNHMDINKQSPVYGSSVNDFASTGGWTLGKSDSGGEYFNKFPLISLSSTQQKRVKAIAENTYRPCCNNSTFFQDCNHGSAAMALIELGVAQGLPDDEIYKTLLHFNSFWFPQNYVEIGLYFNAIKHTNWDSVDPKLTLSKPYSSVTGWMRNVDVTVSKIPGLLPKQQTGGSCGA